MATTIKLEGEARSEFGKGVARRLRVANKIPATIYAGGEEPAFVTLPMRETTLALRHTNALFTIAFDGNTKMAVVKDVQKNPVKRIIEHVDFLEVKAGEKDRTSRCRSSLKAPRRALLWHSSTFRSSRFALTSPTCLRRSL